MPITKSAQKTLRQEKRRRRFNFLIRKKIKLALKTAKKEPTAINVKKAIQILDRAAKKKVIHKNKASRLKSKLAKLVAKSTVKKAAAKKTPSKNKK